MADGLDVAELQDALRTDDASGTSSVPVDGHYGARTVAAVRAWRTRHGLVAANDLPLGSVVFMPGSVRVGRHTTEIGNPAEPGSAPYATTGTTRLVSIELDVARRGTIGLGQAVHIGLASGGSIPGRVTAVGRVAHLPTNSTPDNAARPAITVSVEPLVPPPADEPDEEPVTVDLVTATRPGVLAVPITALLALAEGGYGVEVVGAHGRHVIVAVQPGLFADTMVEISGRDITDATTVVTAR
jgi:peptidoglycan hydrolase-like protein with peptidoglycan-binding domain